MTTLYQLGLDQRNVDCGMSYVFQLNSGHFFLIDGGYFTPGEAERLYSFLCARCIGKPVIADWFFSHAHQDHIGVFIDMIENHRHDLDIRRLTFNFQPLNLPANSLDWKVKSHDLATVKKFYEILPEYCADIPIFTPHTACRWAVEELSMEALFTHEELSVETSFNDHTTVLRVEVAGQSILFLGDIWQEGSKFMLDHCPEKLRCDIVQVSHHGYDGATEAVYRSTGARVALWPTPDYSMKPNANREPNRYLLQESDIVEHIISGYGTARLDLPYVPTCKRAVI